MSIKSIFFFITILSGSWSLPSVALADRKPVLTVYTYDSFASDWGPGPRIKQEYEKKCNCVLNIVSAGSSIGALRKAQLEGAETGADIILGLDTNIAQAAQNTGLFADHGIVAENLSLPPVSVGSLIQNSKWMDRKFLPYDYSYFAFVYNREKVGKVPSSFEELAAMPDNFKIIIQDPRSSTPGLGLLLWVKAVYGDRAASIWKALAPKILTVTKGWSDAYSLFLKGEADMVLSYTTSPAYHLTVDGDDRFDSANFTDGHYMQVEVAGILNASKHKKLARDFLQFMLGEAFQNIIPVTNWTYPVVNTKSGLPEGFKSLRKPVRSLLMDGKEVEAHRKYWIKEWAESIKK